MIGDLINRAKALFAPDKVQKYDPKSLPGLTREYDRIAYLDNEYEKAFAWESSDRARSDKNWKMYSGLDNGQWPDEAVSKLKGEDRHVLSFNLVRGKVDGLAGSIVKNWYDIDFVPMDGEDSDLTMLLKELFYADKELMDWNASYQDVVKDGLIHRAIEQMVISDRYSFLGNIGFERVLPGHAVLDPNWVTNNGWDLKRLFKVAYLTPREMMETYEHKSEEIQKQVEFMARAGQEFTEYGQHGFPHYNLEELYGTKYRVVEYHHMEREKKLLEFARDASGRIVLIPDGSDEYKREWVARNEIDLSDGVIEVKKNIDTYYVSSFCRQLDDKNFLEDRPSRIQIGRLPFFTWSAARINGRDSGIVDLLSDLQQTVNKRESLVDHMIAVSANGGFAYDPILFGEDASSMEDMERNLNKPSKKFRSAPGEIASGRKHFEELPRAPFPNDVINELNRMIDYFDIISKQPPALEGRQESAHETGILFARKQLQAEIMQTTMLRGLEQFWNEKGEAYMLLAQSLYSGVYREIKSPLTKKSVSLNEKVVTENGIEVRNDISQLPRHKVIVTQSPEGVTVRATERAIYADLLRSIPAENIASRAILTRKIMETLDNKTKDRQALVETSELELEFAKESLMAQIAQMQATRMQLEASLQQAGQPGMQGMMQANAQAATGQPPQQEQAESEPQPPMAAQ